LRDQQRHLISIWHGQTGAVLSNGKNPPTEKMQSVGQPLAASPRSEHSASRQPGKWQHRFVLGALLLAFVASFFVYARRSVDFAGYAAVGQAFFDGRDIYLDTPVGTNTWPPFFSLAAVPLGLLDRVSPYFARIVWIALTWASILWALDLLARLIYDKRLRFRADETSLTIASPELLVPFALALPFIINNFELLQINMILFSLALWGLYLQAKGREAAGGIAIAAAAAMKVMSIAFLPYLLYRKRWRAAFWMVAATLVFFFSPALFLGWPKFWSGVALWPAALRASWGAGNAHQSVYSMWDRILGYGYIPFAVPGTFLLPLSGARSAKLAWEITCAVAALLGAIAFRGTPRPDSRWAQVEWAAVFVAATILSPLTRKPYLVVLLLPYALLYAAWRSTELDARTRRVLRNVMFASFALSLPTLHDLIGKSLAVRLEMGSVVTYGSLIMLGGLLWYRSRARSCP
jgi:Glycosyltransferase family 87